MGRAFEFRKERKMKRWAAMSKTFARLNKDIIISIKDAIYAAFFSAVWSAFVSTFFKTIQSTIIPTFFATFR